MFLSHFSQTEMGPSDPPRKQSTQLIQDMDSETGRADSDTDTTSKEPNTEIDVMRMLRTMFTSDAEEAGNEEAENQEVVRAALPKSCSAVGLG